jgi:hypothetical protein
MVVKYRGFATLAELRSQEVTENPFVFVHFPRSFSIYNHESSYAYEGIYKEMS